MHAGRTPEELAAEFEPTAQSIRNWVASLSAIQAWRRRADDSGSAGLHRLRRENRQLRVEREILSKAAAWFARERLWFSPAELAQLQDVEIWPPHATETEN